MFSGGIERHVFRGYKKRPVAGNRLGPFRHKILLWILDILQNPCYRCFPVNFVIFYRTAIKRGPNYFFLPVMCAFLNITSNFGPEKAIFLY